MDISEVLALYLSNWLGRVITKFGPDIDSSLKASGQPAYKRPSTYIILAGALGAPLVSILSEKGILKARLSDMADTALVAFGAGIGSVAPDTLADYTVQKLRLVVVPRAPAVVTPPPSPAPAAPAQIPVF
jgi:hypothetical protein